MTRLTNSTTKTNNNQKRNAPTAARKQSRQTGTIDQYAITNGPCSMNFFGAGTMKTDW